MNVYYTSNEGLFPDKSGHLQPAERYCSWLAFQTGSAVVRAFATAKLIRKNKR